MTKVMSTNTKEKLIKMLADYLFSLPENFKLLNNGTIEQFRQDTKKWVVSAYKWDCKKGRYFIY